MLVFCNPILLLPLAGISHMILHGILCSNLRSIQLVFCVVFWVVFCVVFPREEVLVLFVSIPLLPLAGVSHQILRSILCSISDARGATFVCFNTFAASSWG